MNGWDAFLAGLSRAWRYRRLLLVVLVINLVAALATACPAALNLVGPAKRPAIREASDGLDTWFVVEAFLSPDLGGGQRAAGVDALSQRLQRIGLVGVATGGILLVLAWLSKALVSGGVLSVYFEGDGFSWGRFTRACWRWFGTFLLLGPLQVIATAPLLLLLLVLTVVGFGAAGGWAGWLIVSLCGGVAVLWWATMEMAYIVAVADGVRNVLRSLRLAVGFVLSRPLALAGLYGPAILVAVLLTALVSWGLRPRIPPGAWMLLFSLQQALIVMRLFVRLARLAGGIELYQSRSRFPAA